MEKTIKSNSGFSLIEVLISSVIMLIVIISVYSLILSTQKTQITEDNKVNMNQSIRAIDQILCDNIRNAGSIFTLMGTPAFLSTTTPFAGIYPLNRNNYPDGIILASGDHNAVTKLTSPFNPTGDTTIQVEKVMDVDKTVPAWKLNDIGIVMRSNGYYIFKVAATVNSSATQLTIRATPVYFSGLLNTGGYVDHSSNSNHLGVTGNTNNYPTGSPVFRLFYFSMFLTKTESDGSKTLTLTSDTEGVSDILAAGNETSTRAIPIVPNVNDIQFEYITKDNPPELWASSSTSNTSYPNPCASASNPNCISFIRNFTTKNITSVRVFVLLETKDKHMGGIEKSTGQGYEKRRMGDVAAIGIPAGGYHYTYLTYEILMRNFNIIY